MDFTCSTVGNCGFEGIGELVQVSNRVLRLFCATTPIPLFCSDTRLSLPGSWRQSM